MATFTKLVNFIVEVEGCILKVYLDVAGYPTVGIGHWISPEDTARGFIRAESVNGTYNIDLKRIMQSGVTKQEAFDILDYDMNELETKVPKLVKVPITTNQLIVLISFAFNLGLGALKRSTMLRLLNQWDYDAPLRELPKWVKAGGKVIKGLQNRRKKEMELWSA